MAAARYLVVVVGPESAATDALADDLRDAFAVRTAYSRTDLAATLDEEVDVVLVDSGTPGFSGSSLRAALRERDLDCLVGLLVDTPVAEPPDDVPVDDAPVNDPRVIDEYVRVPEDPRGGPDARWLGDVESLAARAHYRKRLEEYYALAEEYASQRVRDDADDGDPSTHGDDRSASEDRAAELNRLEGLLDTLRTDLAEAYDPLDDEAVFRTALDRPDDERDGRADGDDGRDGRADGDDGRDGRADGDDECDRE